MNILTSRLDVGVASSPLERERIYSGEAEVG